MQNCPSFCLGTQTAGLEQSVIIGVFYNLVKFSAPIFIFVVGFHMVQYSSKQHVPYRTIITDKWKEIIVPYLLWRSVYLLTIPSVNVFAGEGLAGILKSVVAGTAAPPSPLVCGNGVLIPPFHAACRLCVSMSVRTPSLREMGNYNS